MSPSTPCADRLARRADLTNGLVSGLVAGTASGVLLARLEMLPTLALLVGSHSALAGGLVHLLVAAGLGAMFASYLGSATHLHDLVTAGVLYG